jgi:hypothetical protein
MTTSMKLFVFLWLVMTSRIFGSLIGGREALRIRKNIELKPKYRKIYEWFSAFGIGLIMWGIADLGLVWNSIVNGPPNRESYPVKALWFSISFQLLQTIAVWVITLVILNGGAPGHLRKGIFFVMLKIGIMIPKPPDEPGFVESEPFHISELQK